MAERGAHLTANTQLKPSVFEVIAQESLSNTLNPVVKQICRILASTNPQLHWLTEWFEEIYFLLNLYLQHHYLKRKGASFAESFYGLQRISLSSSSSSLSSKQFKLSLFFLTVFPYIREKLEKVAVKYKLEIADGILESSKLPKGSRKLLINIHNLCHIVWESAILIQYFRYMSGNAHSHSPILNLIGISLCYAPEEYETSHWQNMKDSFLQGHWKSLPYLLLKVFGSALNNSFEVVAFFLQFLQYWHTESGETDFELPIPPPPKTLPDASQYKNLCPICLERRQIETVLPVSGFVFCYRCIVHYIEENGVCPVTKYPASVNDLIRLY